VSSDDTSFGLSISKRRQIIGDDDAAELRLWLSHFQDHHETLVLFGLGRIGRLAVERVKAAFDLEAALGGRLRCERRAADRHHRLHIALARIADRKRRCELIGPQATVIGALPRSPATLSEMALSCLASERAASTSQASSCVEVLADSVRALSTRAIASSMVFCGARLPRQASPGRGIAQGRTEIGAAKIELGCGAIDSSAAR